MGKPAIYLRVSSIDQRERQSIQSQEQVMSAWLESQQIDPENGVHWFRDDGISGKQSILARGDGRKLADAVRSGSVSGYVAVYSVSRLSRSAADYFTFREFLREQNVALVGVSEGIDTGRAGGDFAAGIHAVLSEEAHRALLLASKAGHERGARDGRWQGEPPYGYTLDEGRLTINPDQAEAVRLIFQLYLSGMGGTTIARELQDRGIPSKRGGVSWQSRVIFKILRNPAYIGEARYNATRTLRQNGRVVGYAPRDESEHIIVNCPAIVDQLSYDRVQQKLAHRSKQYEHTGAVVAETLLSRVYCGECGARMYAGTRHTGNKRHHYYRHEHRFREKFGHCTANWLVRVDELDPLVWLTVTEAVADPEAWRAELEAQRKAGAGDKEQKELEEIERSAQQARQALERLENAYIVLGTLSDEAYTKHATELGARLERLTERRKEIERRLDSDGRRREQERATADVMRSMRDDIAGAGHTAKREAIDRLVDCVRVRKDGKRIRIEIEWRV